eukprot:221350-Pelagomonas_calceolata.AAC.2
MAWVAALQALLAEDMDCEAALAEGWSLYLEQWAGWHSRSLHAGLVTQERQLGKGSNPGAQHPAS